MWDVLRRGKNLLQVAFLLGIISIICSGILGKTFVSGGGVAHAITLNQKQTVAANCPSPQQPTEKSMLIVLLDRSGSLAATDPEEYSASVTKILADLWPGSMAVLLVSGGGDALQYLGPENLTNKDARKHLRDQIEQQRNMLYAFTPLSPAMDKAFALLRDNGFPAGSRVVLITDGQPQPQALNGIDQIQDIEQRLVPQFCDQGIPVNAFGLDINSATDPNASPLLDYITENTGAASFLRYQEVTNPKNLAEPIIQLYASWRGLKLIPATTQNGNFGFHIDTFASKVDFIAFRSDDTYEVNLLGQDNTTVPASVLQTLTDKHYVFNSMTVARFNQSGIYTVNVSGDPDAQVFALSESRLQLTIITPTSTTIAYAGQPLTIEAALYDQGDPNNHIHPSPGDAVIGVVCTAKVNGQSVSCGEQTLIQKKTPNDDIFSKQITPSGEGTITLNVSATYQYVEIQPSKSVTLQVQLAPCSLSNIGCYWERYQTTILKFGIPGLLLLLLLLWIIRPSPFGALKLTNKNSRPIPLGEGRSLARKIFRKSVISSEELQDQFSDFTNANFDLVFHRGGVAFIKAKSETPPIKLRTGRTTYEEVKKGNKAGIPLSDGNIINISGRDAAIFSDT